MRGRYATRGSAQAAQAERRLAERDTLARAYRDDMRRRTRALRDGPAGPEVRALMSFMANMSLRDGPALVARIEAADWARQMSGPDRLLLLAVISAAIRKLRERNGLPALDDRPFGPTTVLERCKSILEVR